MNNVKNINRLPNRIKKHIPAETWIELATEKLISWADVDKYGKNLYRPHQNDLFIESCDFLDRAQVASRKTGLVMKLCLPEDAEPVATYRMRRSKYDFVMLRSSITLEPGSSFDLTDQTAGDYKETRSTIYFGNDVRFVEVADIALSIYNGATIQLVPVE